MRRSARTIRARARRSRYCYCARQVFPSRRVFRASFSGFPNAGWPTNRERAYVLTQEALREEAGITQIAFSRLLAWLDDGVDSHGERYLEMRRRLVSYFDRRDRPSADELADETLNRIGRTLEQTGVIATKPPARYCYVVARFVLLEDFRRDRKSVPLDEPQKADTLRARGVGPESPASLLGRVVPDSSFVRRELRLACLDRCLQRLQADQRELAIEYYRDHRRERIERRRDLAKRLGITMNALGIRACRVREMLRTCVEACGKEARKV